MLNRSLGALLLAASTVFLTGCPDAVVTRSAAVDQAYRTWYYYPEQDIYHSPTHHEYWFRDAATNSWVRSKQLPPTVTLRGQTVTVADKSPEPWRRHHEHVEAYRNAGK